ncbi:MAG: aldehyde dehydrogenase family protein [Bacteroidetes bacterium]|nr:MAG: aldehyde dehydrogenase family protein [Bacteroidota bacterium]
MDQIEKQKVKELNGKGANGESSKEGRLNVMKTYKIYIDGKFPRTESGRYYILKDKDGNTIANICQGSRKDFRDAVVAARKAQHSWASRSAYNRGQILYRIAEMLEGRRAQFVAELMQQGSTSVDAESEVSAAVDRFVYYAGWCDKYQQVFSSVNPVESSHFNFSLPEATGVVSILADEETSLIGLATAIAPAIAGGNTVVTLASSSKPLCAVTFAEVLNSSDVPGGVVNIITGYRKELITHFSNHMDVNACIYFGEDKDQIKTMKEHASLNVKRPLVYSGDDLLSDSHQNPYRIMDLQEIKTTWHPIGQ